MDRFILKAEDGGLILSVGEEGCTENWCRVCFVRGDDILKLGADSFDIVCKRMAAALSDIGSRKPSSFDGLEICTLIDLMEPHCTLAYSIPKDGAVTLIRIDDKNKKAIPLCTLTEAERLDWVKKLGSFAQTQYNEKDALS